MFVKNKIYKKFLDNPLLLYMQNSDKNKIQNCALFSDVSVEELLNSKELVSDVLNRVGIDINTIPNDIPSLSFGYMICKKDHLILELKVNFFFFFN